MQRTFWHSEMQAFRNAGAAPAPYKKPELHWPRRSITSVWSSEDYHALLGPKKWSYYYVYVIMDIYSRYVVGWMVADQGGTRPWPAG